MEKCRATGKVIFASAQDARIAMFNLKWGFKKHKDLFGKRIKHRQGRPDQRRAYYCVHCDGYHLTKWKTRAFRHYRKKMNEVISRSVSSYAGGVIKLV